MNNLTRGIIKQNAKHNKKIIKTISKQNYNFFSSTGNIPADPLKKNKVRASFLFDGLDFNRQNKLFNIFSNLVKGERSVCLIYVASKLKDNDDNKKFFTKLVNSIKDKRDFDVNEEIKKGINVFGRSYNKKSVVNTPYGNEIVKVLYGYQKDITIKRGINEIWEDYKSRVECIEDVKKRSQKIKEYEDAKKFLEERDFLTFIPDARNGIQIYHSLKQMEDSAGLKITRENYDIESLGKSKDMIKGKLSDVGLEDFGSELKKVNDLIDEEVGKNKIQFKPAIPKPSNDDYGEFGFYNKGSKKFTKIVYDVETDKVQEVCLIGCYNKDLKRIVLAEVKKKIRLKEGETKINPKFEKYYKDGFEIIKCEIVNGYEALFLADAETYLACVCNSLMRQGDNTPSILKDMVKGIKINYDFFLEIVNNKRRSMWLAHNSNFDINKLNLTSRKGLLHIDNSGVIVEDIQINTFGDTKRYTGYIYNPNNLNDREKWSVSHKLGNRNIGVYFKASTRKYGLWEKPEIELKPIQKESDNYIIALDSVLIARALQKKGASLKALCDEYDTDVKKSESEYNFTGKELWRDSKKDINEVEYLIKDLFATDYIFRELCKELDVVGDLLGLVNIDPKRIKKHASDVPYLYRIYSTASLSKLFYQMKYSEDYDDWKVRQSNSKFYENINDIFKEVYSGGRVEIFKHGIMRNKKIIYSDFASLYPHTSYLTNVEQLMKDILNKKLEFTSDIETIENDFWIMVKSLSDKIISKQKISKDDFSDSAVVNVKLKDVSLRLSRKASIFRGEIKTDANKRNRCDLIVNSGSNVNVSNFDLCYSILEKHLIDGVSFDELKKQILFNNGLMVVPTSRTTKEDDMHTLLYGKRGNIKKEISEIKDVENNQEKIKHLESQSQFMKIILNAGYGITAEFTKDKAGQFYNPILASTITSMARLLNNLTEISSRYYGFEVYYTDTDSLLLDAGGFEIVGGLFEDVCELKNELSEGAYIKDLVVVGAKEYAYFTNKKDEYSVKTHGVGYRARGYKDVLDKLFRDLIQGVDKDKAIQSASKLSPLLRGFNFSHIRGKTNTLYTGLSDIVNKKKEVLGEYEIDGSVFRCYEYGKTGLFITDCESITKGTFGSMLRLSEPKIYFFSVKYGFNEDMLKEVIEKIDGIPDEKRKVILERLENKYSEVLFLEKYLGKNEDNVKRKILEDGVCVPFNCDVKEDIDISFNEKELALDGVEYFGIADLPKFNFASKMQADLTTYYSKAITSMSKSLSYWFAKRQNPESADDVFNKRNNELLIPQKKNEILVPLNMVEVPDSEIKIIDMLQENKKNKVLDMFYYRAKPNEFRKIKKGVNFEEIKDTLLSVLKPRNTIITEVFNGKKYWFEVTSYKANKNNAILRINVVVGNPPKIKYYLWINPTPFFNVKLWKASYTDLMFSAESLSNVVEKVFDIAFHNSDKSHGVMYNSVLSSFSRGASYSLEDLKKNNKYFLDICYAVACSFIVMNSIKHSSLRIGRLDLSYNVKRYVSSDKQDLVITLLQKQLTNEVNNFLDFKTKKDFVERVKLSEQVYTASGGHYSGLVNKRTKISQVIYNKSKQLDYKLLKSSRKKSFSALMLKRLNDSKDNFKNIWRLEVQAYGYNAIQKSVNNYDRVMKKLTKLLNLVMKIVDRVNMREFDVLKEFGEESKEFNYWFNDLTKDRYKPPAILST